MITSIKVQKKVHEELDEKIGSDRPISMEDKVNLNYVNATVAVRLLLSLLELKRKRRQQYTVDWYDCYHYYL